MLSTRGAAGREHRDGLEAQKRRPDGEDDILRSVRLAGGRARHPGAREDARRQRVARQEGGPGDPRLRGDGAGEGPDRKSTRLNSSHSQISYAVFCLKKKKDKKAHVLLREKLVLLHHILRLTKFELYCFMPDRSVNCSYSIY